MSSEFNASEFRRNRSGDADAPKKVEAPAPPAAMPVAASNPYAAALETAPAVIPEAVPNPYAAALAQSAPQATVPVSVPAPSQGSHISGVRAQMAQNQAAQAQAVQSHAAPEGVSAPAKTSLLAGLLSKFKKSDDKASDNKPADTPAPVQTGPVEYLSAETAAAPVMPTVQDAQTAVPVMPNSVPVSPSTFTASVPVEITARTKPYLPTWAAFALGALTGVILTFAVLAMMGDNPANTLEARFGADKQQVVTVPAEVALSEMDAAQADTIAIPETKPAI